MLQNMQCTVTLLWSAIVILNLFKFIIAILKLQIWFSFIVVVRALMWYVQSLFYLLKNVTDSRQVGFAYDVLLKNVFCGAENENTEGEK